MSSLPEPFVSTIQNDWSVTRKADRAQMANQIQALANHYGVKVERKEGHPYPGQKTINLSIEAPRGLGVNVSIDGSSATSSDSFVVPWHVVAVHNGKTNDTMLSPSFGSVNPFHFGKATHVAYGFGSLMKELERGIRSSLDGSAFMPEDVAIQVKQAIKARYEATLKMAQEKKATI